MLGECNNVGPLRQPVPNRNGATDALREERTTDGHRWVPPPSRLMSCPALACEQQAVLYGLAVG